MSLEPSLGFRVKGCFSFVFLVLVVSAGYLCSMKPWDNFWTVRLGVVLNGPLP